MALNDAGTIKTSYINFLDVMGIKNEAQMVIKTSTGRVNYLVKTSTSIGMGIIVSYMFPGAGMIANLVIDKGVSYLVDKAIPVEGNDLYITIVDEVYDKETGRYDIFSLEDDYAKGEYFNSVIYYRNRIAIVKDNYSPKTSIFDNSIY